MSKISTKNYHSGGTGWYNYDDRIDAGLVFTSSDGVLDERLTLTDIGKVGINNTSPSATLDIKVMMHLPQILRKLYLML